MSYSQLNAGEGAIFATQKKSMRLYIAKKKPWKVMITCKSAIRLISQKLNKIFIFREFEITH